MKLLLFATRIKNVNFGKFNTRNIFLSYTKNSIRQVLSHSRIKFFIINYLILERI